MFVRVARAVAAGRRRDCSKIEKRFCARSALRSADRSGSAFDRIFFSRRFSIDRHRRAITRRPAWDTTFGRSNSRQAGSGRGGTLTRR